MKALATQFDNKRLSSAVATPTCSSCCCCCCCLATSLATSSLLAQRINKEGKKRQVRYRGLLVAIAALFIPIIIATVYVGFLGVTAVARTCVEREYGYSTRSLDSYTSCYSPGLSESGPYLYIGATVLVFVGLLTFLYQRVGVPNPVGRALLVLVLYTVAFGIEFVAGAALVLSTAGIAYLLLIPLAVGWISLWYHKHIGKEVADDPAAQQTPPAPGTE